MQRRSSMAQASLSCFAYLTDHRQVHDREQVVQLIAMNKATSMAQRPLLTLPAVLSVATGHAPTHSRNGSPRWFTVLVYRNMCIHHRDQDRDQLLICRSRSRDVKGSER